MRDNSDNNYCIKQNIQKYKSDSLEDNKINFSNKNNYQKIPNSQKSNKKISHEIYFNDDFINNKVQSKKKFTKAIKKNLKKNKKEKLNISTIESKIKNQVSEHKNIFIQKKKTADEYYNSLGYDNYDDWANQNGNNTNEDSNKKRYQGPVEIKKYYILTYDKNLEHAKIKENNKEVPVKQENPMKIITNEFIENLNNKNNNGDEKAEMLSSFTPSEKTKSKINYFIF